MANPFEKRATEYLREDEAAFLSLVSPDPLQAYLGDAAKRGQLFERLIRIVGTPGSGKTTLATLLEARMVEAVLADPEKEGYADIIQALEVCQFVEKGKQKIAAVRLPMEGEYRDFWELPYEEALRTRLVLALIQARAVLGLVRNLERRHRRNEIKFIPRSDAVAALEEIGGGETEALVKRAREVERAVYDIGARLVPPRADEIAEAAARPFRPFDVIDAVEVTGPAGEKFVFKPLVILDDAHNLSPRQFAPIFRDLSRREIRIGRWIMMRLDLLSPETALGDADDKLAPELKPGRDYVDVFLQRPSDRGKTRTAFRSMARSMADRYLRRHPTFERRQYRNFSALLSTEPEKLSDQAYARLLADVTKTKERLHVSARRVEVLRKEVERYADSAQNQDVGRDVQAAMLKILIHRYTNRVPQQSLFEGEERDPAPRQEVSADAGVAEGARVHLRHLEKRALHFGLATISDASSENAELFLHLSAALVDRMEARVINGGSPQLSARQQDRILEDRSTKIIEGWNFPFAPRARDMVTAIADDCLRESLRLNAPLGGGANAVAIPQADFQKLLGEREGLVQVLHYASAYNAITVYPNYGQGGKQWCLIELGGPVILRSGLTLRRGGFLERQLDDLLKYAGIIS
jgi:hypothetical protein